MAKSNKLLSVLCIVLAAMLVFTALPKDGTFAWFSDSVNTGENIITSGTLKAGLESSDAFDAGYVDASNGTLFSYNLWEPGYTAVKYIKVSNKGTLAFKYSLNLASDETVNENGVKLSDVIDVYVGTSAISGRNGLAGMNRVGTLAQVMASAGGAVQGTLTAGTSNTYCIALHMQESAGNEYQNLSVGNGFAVKLYANQLTHESDSFDNQYDAGGNLPEAWDGETAPEVPEADENNVILINNAAELAAFAADVNAGNSYAGKTVKLNNDINLDNKAWTPIGACDSAAYFQGTFDGNGFTIYGLNVDKSSDAYMNTTAGFFGWIDAAAATIKNVNFSGATVKGSHWVGVVAGFMTGEISNCNVTNSTVIANNVNNEANGDKAGGIVGYMNSGAGKLDGNSVTNSSITGNRDVAGLAGAVVTTNTVTNNRVANVNIYYAADYAAEIVSAKTAVVVDESNTASNVTLVKGIQVAEGVYKNGKNYTVTSKDGLLNIGNVVKAASPSEANILSIDLITDVDLAGVQWTPIESMWITFNGNGHTIKNISAGKDNYVGRSGFWGYAGAVTMNDLTLENVTSSGTQAGTFAGSADGLKLNNCTLKGTNKVTWAQNPAGQYQETWSGIGAITGVATSSNINATIAEGTTVTLDYNDMTTDAPYVDTLTGYIEANNGTVINNGTITTKKNATVSDATELSDAINNGATEITLTAGTYKMPNVSAAKEFTISGTADTVIDVTLGAYMDSSKVSFEGVTIKGSTGKANGNGSDYAALYTPNVTYTNCTFDGPFRIGRDGATFINCKFTNLGNDYVWTYGNTATFTGCTFESEGKALLIYSDGNGNVPAVSVTNCTFNATKGAKAGAIANQNCAAIEIDNYGCGVNLTLSGNIIDTKDREFSGEWRIKSYYEGKEAVIVNGTEYTSIAIDGKTMTKDASNNVTVNG